MRRNILLLHCHDLGRFLGAYGVETVDTPRLDRFATESVVFDAAFSTSPHCSPARASLFTGTYPQQNGVLGLTHAPFGWDLTNPAAHVAHRLHEIGYRTELIGVHHESRTLPDDEVATRLGFDRVRSGGGRDQVVERAREALSTAVAEDRPFYIQVGFHEPHRNPTAGDRQGVMGFLGEGITSDDSQGVTIPSYLHPDADAREELAELQGAVRHMDSGVGAVLDELERLEIVDETIVVFTTDHGLALPRAKCTLYDAGLGVALIVRAPGKTAWTGQRFPGLVSHVDVLPTLLELVGAEMPEDVAGTSLVAMLDAGAPSREHAFGQLSFHTYFDPKRSVRSADAKLIVNFSNAPKSMDPTQSWTHRTTPIDLTGPTVGTSPLMEFYDLERDPHELENLIDDPSRISQISDHASALRRWMSSVDDPLLTEPASPRHALALDTLARIGLASAPPASNP